MAVPHLGGVVCEKMSINLQLHGYEEWLLLYTPSLFRNQPFCHVIISGIRCWHGGLENDLRPPRGEERPFLAAMGEVGRLRAVLFIVQGGMSWDDATCFVRGWRRSAGAYSGPCGAWCMHGLAATGQGIAGKGPSGSEGGRRQTLPGGGHGAWEACGAVAATRC